MSKPANQSRMIAAEDAEAFKVLPGRADLGLVILCDHAENTIAPEYGTLGLPEAQLQRHIAYDIGAAAITEMLAASLGVPAVLSRFSRLLIDPNRGDDDPTLIMRLSDGAVIPSNRDLDETERNNRIRRFYRPYHGAIARTIEACLATGVPPALLSLHSFTESWKDVPRPWHVGILWDKDPRLAKPLLDGFFAEGALIVGDNQPYKGSLRGDCLWQHGTARGFANAIIEYRQDLVRDRTGQRLWAERTDKIMRALLACDIRGPALKRIEHHGSLSDPKPRLGRALSFPSRADRRESDIREERSP